MEKRKKGTESLYFSAMLFFTFYMAGILQLLKELLSSKAAPCLHRVQQDIRGLGKHQ